MHVDMEVFMNIRKKDIIRVEQSNELTNIDVCA